jgi:peptide/nickel transport system substrate-binding protein
MVSRYVIAAGAVACTLSLLAPPAEAQAQQPPQAQQAPAKQAPQAQQAPKRGGTLNFAISAEPPNYDCHANSSFAAIHWLAPHYSTLLKFDIANYPKIVGDVAQSWEVSKDQLTYTFKLRPNIKFHDGSQMTSADIKATYDRLRKPPEGVVSLRQGSFEDIASVDTPDPQTVVFKLSKPDASMLANFASPWNCIYSAAKLKQDANFPKNNILGTGAFRFVEHVKGSHWTGHRFDGYFQQGKPYLDGFRAVLLSGAPMINAMQGGQIMAEFRGFSPAERDRLVQTLGDKVRVQESGWVCKLDILFNTSKKPFDDPRVRRALSMSIDRWGGAKNLQRIAFVKEVGSIIRPGYEFAAKKDELTKYPGFSENMAQTREQAKALLKQAGVPDLKFRLTNRNVAMPYTPSGLFVIDQWRQIGVQVEHNQLETAPYQASLQSGNYEAGLNFACDFMDEPNLQLLNYISEDKSSLNYGKYKDPKLDDFFEKQKRATNKGERTKLIREFERHLFEQSYAVPLIWWQRIIVHDKRVNGWHVSPSHYIGQDLTDVWLAQ